jgi:hypothetical protein
MVDRGRSYTPFLLCLIGMQVDAWMRDDGYIHQVFVDNCH